MDQKFIKRNYTYLIYDILKKESGKNEKHFTAEELIKIISKRYNVEPNRKTIYTVIDDLIALGFDIKKQKEGQNRGYFLDKRIVKRGDFALVLDGVCSIKDLDIDYKQKIIDDLCNAIGYDYLKLDLYEYESRNLNIDSNTDNSENIKPNKKKKPQEFALLLNTIIEAISGNKKIEIKLLNYQTVSSYLLELPNNNFKAYVRANTNNSFMVNPFQIFRNNENQLCLIYFIKSKNDTFVFATPIIEFINVEIINSRREKTDSKVRNINLDNFTNAKEYRRLIENNTTKYFVDFQITFGLHLDSELFQIITSYLDSYIFIEKNGEKYIHGYYLAKNESTLEVIAIRNSKYLKIYPGCRLWEHLKYLAISLQKYTESN